MVQQATAHPVATVLEEGIIRSVGDLINLGIIDWTRYAPYWKNEYECMQRLGSWFINRFSYKVVELNLHEYPQRDDFPGWKHVGDHEEIGKLYWNHFKYCFDGELNFHDSPDFSGVIYHRDRDPQEWYFWGDVGHVSPLGMREAVNCLIPHTLWISVLDDYNQVILEPLIPVESVLVENKPIIPKPKQRRKARKNDIMGQLSLFDI